VEWDVKPLLNQSVSSTLYSTRGFQNFHVSICIETTPYLKKTSHLWLAIIVTYVVRLR